MAEGKVNKQFNVGDLQKEVCRDIIDTREVLKSQIGSALMGNLSKKVDEKLLRAVIQHVDNTLLQQTNSLIDRTIKKLS